MTDLLDLLRTADPAAGLPPLDDADRTRLLRRATAAPPRRRTPRLALAALVPVAAAAVVVTVLATTTHSTRIAETAPPKGKIAVGRPLALTVPGTDPTAQCLPVADIPPSELRGADIAFSGLVTAVTGDEVVVTPDRFFRGAATSEVRLTGRAGEDASTFRDGERVLIAANDGATLGCGISGEDSAALRAVWERAFGS